MNQAAYQKCKHSRTWLCGDCFHRRVVAALHRAKAVAWKAGGREGMEAWLRLSLLMDDLGITDEG